MRPKNSSQNTSFPVQQNFNQDRFVSVGRACRGKRCVGRTLKRATGGGDGDFDLRFENGGWVGKHG
jgi:hypothetical protein|tara:strand:- start:9245 stop:9442 length:198 start_codon:yes stop_codon:yes gene_type:complete